MPLYECMIIKADVTLKDEIGLTFNNIRYFLNKVILKNWKFVYVIFFKSDGVLSPTHLTERACVPGGQGQRGQLPPPGWLRPCVSLARSDP